MDKEGEGMNPRNPRVIVFVRGGVVSFTTPDNIDVTIVDYDLLEENTGIEVEGAKASGELYTGSNCTMEGFDSTWNEATAS